MSVSFCEALFQSPQVSPNNGSKKCILLPSVLEEICNNFSAVCLCICLCLCVSVQVVTLEPLKLELYFKNTLDLYNIWVMFEYQGH